MIMRVVRFVSNMFEISKKGILIVLASVFSVLLLSSLLVLKPVRFDPLRHFLLTIETAATPDRTVAVYDCSNWFAWRVIVHDLVAPGNPIELGTQSELHERFELALSRDGVLIPTFLETDAYDYPAQLQPIKGYLLSEMKNTGADLPGVPIELRAYVYASGEAISSRDKDILARCLLSNKGEIEGKVSPYGAIHALLFLSTMNEVISARAGDDRPNASGILSRSPTMFLCGDGSRIEIRGSGIYRDYRRISTVRPEAAGADETRLSAFGGCIDDNGSSLAEHLNHLVQTVVRLAR